MSSVRDIVTTTSGEKAPFERVLLRPSFTPPREGLHWVGIQTYRTLTDILWSIFESQYVAVDFETRGDYTDSDHHVAGIGLAWDNGCVYFDWKSLYFQHREALWTCLRAHKGLLAHNVYFDGGVAKISSDTDLQWHACTLALYMYLSNEGFPGQQWGLKSAQKDILLWPETNEKELDLWLILNGYYKGNRLRDESPENLTARAMDGSLSPEKGEMWRAPCEILGRYCQLDAESTYLLFTEHLEPCSREFPELKDFFHQHWMPLISLHIRQKILGIEVDRPGLEARALHLAAESARLVREFRSQPNIKEHIAAIEQEMLRPLLDSEPAQFKKLQPRPPEPSRFKKDGTPSKAHERWLMNAHKYEQPEVSKSWLNWQERFHRAVDGEDEAYQFNPNSGDQLRLLFYHRMGMPIKVQTDSGLPSTSAQALQHMGPTGKLLVERAFLEKEAGYISDYIQRSEKNSTIHPSFRLPGTVTGRLSSKQPNLQQIPKSKAVMSRFRARKGMVWVDLDFMALEAVVAAELSGDPNLMELYATGKPENDIHLFVGANVPGEFGQRFLQTGYTPVNPKSGTVSKAKKECKAERNIIKGVVYGCQFGMGVDLMEKNLEADGIIVSRLQVEAMHAAYWKSFARLKKYGYELQDQWKRNGGYVLNAFGRPMCIHPDAKKDALSRVVQSTGHDILVRYISILRAGLDEAGIDWHPLIIDWHDASTVEVPQEQAEQTVDVFRWAMDELNRQLGCEIKLKGTPVVGRTLADVKEPEE